MDFNISNFQKEMLELIKELSNKKLNENVFEDDEKQVFSRDKWNECAALDILALPLEEQYGGMGETMLTMAMAIQALGRYCKDEGLIFSICAHFCTCIVPIWKLGTEKQKERYLPKLVSGEHIGGNGSTEAEAGSDLSSMKTKVTRQENFYLLNGAKIFVTNGPVADVLILYGIHQDGIKIANISGFIVEKGFEGVSVGQVFHKMGLRTSPIAEIILNGCRVPEENLLGRERWGMMGFNKSMYWERILMSAYHLGAMEQQFNIALEYANNRKQFETRIKDFQSISGKLVEMRANIETSRWLLYNACWRFDNGMENLADASMVKLVVSNAKIKNSLDAVQIFGAYGFMKEYMVEKQLRDSIPATIYSGTSEIQKKIISEGLEKIDG
ncbi:L-prolyl-[peptidyl carrier protein] dehydrogenase [Anaerobacterium chartisolvens]|uniref:L-prolyl-[peptidyl carrier protein] dehydrogenase n=1 Tax=Anaerobacterium chartisolvens TaxID=1297424 RepID=A0A369B492_9FIRM|nr:acyl-CoA dehydrogenase family protein [Anaerobacterium chartisolvens]RCX16303.1 L-prolyl-[peptidyl carrier protein] dehydrogenase [Anaerobacterium chartisolvens]